MNQLTQPKVTIDHENLRHNVSALSSRIAPAKVMMAVKTNAYGHGLVEVSQTALSSGAAALAVLEVSSGVALRDQGITAPLFAWLLGDADDFTQAAQHDIDLGISSSSELAMAAHASTAGRRISVHLKIDTGLTRNGAPEQLWPQLCTEAAALHNDGQVTVTGIWSHLADASPADDDDSLRIFRSAVDVAQNAGLEASVFHLGASSAGLRFPQSHLDFVRFGIAAYGISPFEHLTAADLDLRPVMTLTAPVVGVDGESLILGAGYGHGVLVGEHPDRHVVICGEPWHVLSLDVDSMRVLGPRKNARDLEEMRGETAFIFGDGGPSAEVLGAWCGTIGDEVVTSVSSLLHRDHVHR